MKTWLRNRRQTVCKPSTKNRLGRFQLRTLMLEPLEERTLLNGAPPDPHGLFPGEEFWIGHTPYTLPSVATGDLNGDGAVDIVTANEVDNDVSVLLGNGDGTLSGEVKYPVGRYASSVEIGDVNGDGVLDIVTGSTGPDRVSVLLGQGPGTFGAASYYPVGQEPVSVTLGKLNDDEAMDIVAVNQQDNSISVLLSNGAGGFHPHITYDVGPMPSSAALGDLDDDGILDIVVANAGDDNSYPFTTPGR